MCFPIHNLDPPGEWLYTHGEIGRKNLIIKIGSLPHREVAGCFHDESQRNSSWSRTQVPLKKRANWLILGAFVTYSNALFGKFALVFA